MMKTCLGINKNEIKLRSPVAYWEVEEVCVQGLDIKQHGHVIQHTQELILELEFDI